MCKCGVGGRKGASLEKYVVSGESRIHCVKRFKGETNI
jgi:hypothetical protein